MLRIFTGDNEIMRLLTTLLFLFFLVPAQAQLSAKDGIELRRLLLEHVNELRDSVGLPALEENSFLQKAAIDHSKYMVKSKVLSHEEKGPGRTVAKRVKRAGTRDFEIVGENILYNEVGSFKLNQKKLEALAREMYLQWRNSPGHYRNMIQQAYVFGDIGIAADSKTGRIYATQVFGAKGTRVEGQLSKNGFGIRASREDCKGLFENVAVNIGNSTWISNDTVYLAYHNKSVIEKFFSGPKDGVAVDLVTAEQVSCGGPNILDMSKVYDGILLEPTYGREMISGNTAEGENRIITKIGIVPPELVGKELSIGLIYIKNGQSCRYTYPAYVPSEPYVMEPFEPKMKKGNVTLPGDGIIRTEILPFDFERGALISKNSPKVPKYVEKVHSLRVLSYSSVEGSSQSNIKLHEDRAKFIINYIKQRTNTTGAKVEVDARENWQMMDYQLRFLFADSLSKLSQDELKSLIASGDQTLDWDQLLFEQRSSKAFINYYGVVSSDPSMRDDYLKMNLRTALAEDDMNRANQAMYEIMNGAENVSPSIIFDPQVFDALLKEKELVQNAAALISKVYNQDRAKATLFVHAWALSLNELDRQAKENVLFLYSLLGYQLVQEWDVSAKRLSNVIHPKRLEGLINNDLPAEILLNANLTFLYYYGHTLEQEGIERSFEYVADYVEDKSLNQELMQKLTLFFNNWSQYQRTVETLLASYEDNSISPVNMRILMHTAVGYNLEDKRKDKFFELMEKMSKEDQEYWCNWLSTEFQILRSNEVKQIYCTSCPN